MGLGENSNIQERCLTWNDVKTHNNREDLWLVINNNVYDLTKFQKKHPGGIKVINYYGGRDATVCFFSS
jgi:cytochrome b5